MLEQPTASELAAELKSLLERQEGLEARLEVIDVDTVGYPELHARFLCPTFRDGFPLVSELAEFLTHRIVSYCIPRAERKRAIEAANQAEGMDVQAIARLVDKARRLFIKAEQHLARTGEAGELLLYALIERYLGAPLVVAKMLLKTNSQMPVHGTDGIHAKYDPLTQKLILYFGESKLHATLSSALGSAAVSINTFLTDPLAHTHEIQLITDHADLSVISEKQRQVFLDFLDPYKDSSNARVERIACLLSFDEDAFADLSTLPREERRSAFHEAYTKKASKHLSNLRSTLQSKGLDATRIDFFLVPVPSVDDFRRAFKEALHG